MIEQLLEAGRWAPSASNRQPWRFIVIRDEAVRREVARHAGVFFIRWAHVEDAPLIIALLGDTGNRMYRAFLHEDVGLAGSQIMLQAAALGLGTCWLGGIDRKALAGVLQVPERVEIVGLLTVGFPAEEPEPPPRKPLAELVHYDVYGSRDVNAPASPGLVTVGWLRRIISRLRIRIRL